MTDALRRAGLPGLDTIGIVDRYDHEEAGQPVRTLTWQLTFAGEADRTVDELNALLERAVGAVGAALGDLGVKLR
ncbi:MAG TPA: hypothetical protein PKA64_06725 [Myxococcota bacterium]|nr:hypothetical protein [Myxococcota bacterium]